LSTVSTSALFEDDTLVCMKLDKAIAWVKRPEKLLAARAEELAENLSKALRTWAALHGEMAALAVFEKTPPGDPAPVLPEDIQGVAFRSEQLRETAGRMRIAHAELTRILAQCGGLRPLGSAGNGEHELWRDSRGTRKRTK
jgi:hypothetical protein